MVVGMVPKLDFPTKVFTFDVVDERVFGIPWDGKCNRNYSIHGWYRVETCCFFRIWEMGEGLSTCRVYEELSILGAINKNAHLC